MLSSLKLLALSSIYLNGAVAYLHRPVRSHQHLHAQHHARQVYPIEPSPATGSPSPVPPPGPPEPVDDASTIDTSGDDVIDSIQGIQQGLADLPDDLLAFVNNLQARLQDLEGLLEIYFSDSTTSAPGIPSTAPGQTETMRTVPSPSNTGLSSSRSDVTPSPSTRATLRSTSTRTSLSTLTSVTTILTYPILPSETPIPTSDETATQEPTILAPSLSGAPPSSSATLATGTVATNSSSVTAPTASISDAEESSSSAPTTSRQTAAQPIGSTSLGTSDAPALASSPTVLPDPFPGGSATSNGTTSVRASASTPSLPDLPSTLSTVTRSPSPLIEPSGPPQSAEPPGPLATPETSVELSTPVAAGSATNATAVSPLAAPDQTPVSVFV